MSHAELYTDMTFRVRLPNATDDGTAMTTADTFTYTVLDNRGAALSPANTGNFTYTAADERWDATITAPSVAGRYHIHIAATKGSHVGFGHLTVLIKPRT